MSKIDLLISEQKRDILRLVDDVKKETTLLCALMIEGSERIVPYTGEFGNGYKCAQKEFTEMLRKVADGELIIVKPNEPTNSVG